MGLEKGTLRKWFLKLIKKLAKTGKVYDCHPHDLLIVKLAAYGFGKTALSLITDYLTYRLQRVKIGSTFNSY